MRSSYFKFNDKTGFARFADTDLVFMDGPYVYARYTATAQPLLHLIPPHNFGPPERCYYTLETGHPGAVVHSFGQGKAIYIPWEPGALFHRQGYTNTIDFIADLLAGTAGLVPVGGNLSPMVEVTWFENLNSGRRLLHLINGSGHFGTSFYAPISMTDLEVIIPCSVRPVSVKSLGKDRACNYTWQEGQLTIQVETLDLFEAMEVSF
jgi:hypothetical protein